MKFNKVFETGKIRNMELPNRLVVSAMSSHLGNDDGTPNEQVIRYLEAKADHAYIPALHGSGLSDSVRLV